MIRKVTPELFIPATTQSCRACNGEPIVEWKLRKAGDLTHHTCYPGEERQTLVEKAIAAPPDRPTSAAMGGDKHYAALTPEPADVIDAWSHLNWKLCNALKYLARAGLKDGEAETKDLRKAIDYIARRINQLEGRKGWKL